MWQGWTRAKARRQPPERRGKLREGGGRKGEAEEGRQALASFCLFSTIPHPTKTQDESVDRTNGVTKQKENEKAESRPAAPPCVVISFHFFFRSFFCSLCCTVAKKNRRACFPSSFPLSLCLLLLSVTPRARRGGEPPRLIKCCCFIQEDYLAPRREAGVQSYHPRPPVSLCVRCLSISDVLSTPILK